MTLTYQQVEDIFLKAMQPAQPPVKYRLAPDMTVETHALPVCPGTYPLIYDGKDGNFCVVVAEEEHAAALHAIRSVAGIEWRCHTYADGTEDADEGEVVFYIKPKKNV